MPESTELSTFINYWGNAGGAERANYQLFLIGLCELLKLPRPDPTTPDDAKNNYVFDRSITATNPDGTTTTNFIDLYKRAHFVIETKQGVEKDSGIGVSPMIAKPKRSKKGHGVRNTPLWNDALLRAKSQAENYVRNIPDDNPPFLLVVDVGYQFETYADFSGLGKTYTPFPDNLSHRFKLTDLADPKRGPDLLDRLKKIWTDPQSLNPAKRTAKATREIAAKLAELSKSLEKSGHHPEAVAHFLMRFLFTCFAEDVHLLGKKKEPFTDLLRKLEQRPENFAHSLQALWHEMDRGGFSSSIQEHLLQFNGSLFKDTQALPLESTDIARLIEAAEKDWSQVEPAIFGTLLERALDPTERHKLGAHYTPRAYVERLVLPTVIEPLRDQWRTAQDKAVQLLRSAAEKKAAADEIHATTEKLNKKSRDLASESRRLHRSAMETVIEFLRTLCNTIVLDPACGSGNFLYVTLEHMKRLEGEVRDFMSQFAGDLPLEWKGLTVDPHQLRGIEINPRAAAITDLVLWIGYLQWHFRTHGQTKPREPVLQKFDNIECRDAVLVYDKKELARDEHGKPLSRWDSKTFKRNAVTGENVPDEKARSPLYTFQNPKVAAWPKADYVVGNPPFIGNKKMRVALGHEYVDALRIAHSDVSESVDFVMYWWDHAAKLLMSGNIQRFGFITTNSITMAFNRRVLETYLESGLRLAFAIPDHPWVDSNDGAAVRIAMTVTVRQVVKESPVLALVTNEVKGDLGEEDTRDFDVVSQHVTTIHPNLSVGPNVGSLKQITANLGLANMGVTPLGDGFRLTRAEVTSLGFNVAKLPTVIKKYIIGRDLVQTQEERYIIDFFGLSADQARREYPTLMQRVIDTVKPERDQNKRESRKKNWWLFGEPGATIRPIVFSIPRYIGTCQIAKHRLFTYLSSDYLPDQKVVNIGLNDAFFLGVLSSRPHLIFATATGSTLEDRPCYNHTLCFNTFPFPDCTAKQKKRIRDLAEELDAHRKRQLAKYPGKNGLTLTDMYNVLEKLRAIDAGTLTNADFTPQDKQIHDRGLISILKQLHDDLDTAVFDAYGWPPDLTDDQLLEKLVALNHQRAEEESRGIIKYLRPEFQKAHTK